jgi:hypothetical protein
MNPGNAKLLWTRLQFSDVWLTPANVRKNQLTQMPSGLWVTTKEKRLFVPDVLRDVVLYALHDVSTAGHPGVERTLRLVSATYWWPTLGADVARYVRTCGSCQRNKSATAKPVGFLNPLPVATEPFESISMDFITELPLTARGHDTLFVVVDRFSKMVHLAPCHNSLTAQGAADLLLGLVFKLHGTPSSFYADRDKLWMSQFYQRWCSRLQIDLHLSSAYHPQSDGQTERMNRLLEEVLRHYVTPSQDNWDELLPLAEFAINRANNASTGRSPFHIVFGYQPKTPLDRFYQSLTADTASAAVPIPDRNASSARAGTHKAIPAADDEFDRYRSEFSKISDLLQLARDRQKAQFDKRRRPAPDYQVGDKVYVDTKILRVVAVGTPKFLQRWQGPFEVTKVIKGVVSKEVSAVKVKLPDKWRVHPVFHVSAVKPYPPDTRGTEPPPVVLVEGYEEYHVDQILSHRFSGRKKDKLQYFVSWTGYDSSENSWVSEIDLTTDGEDENLAITAYWDRLKSVSGTNTAPSNPAPVLGPKKTKKFPTKTKLVKPAAAKSSNKRKCKQKRAAVEEPARRKSKRSRNS